MKLSINLDSDHEIQIGAHKVKIKFVENTHSRIDDDYGCYVTHEKTIYINKTVPETLKFSSLLHEIEHAIEDIYGVELDHTILNLIGEALSQALLMYKENETKKIKKK